MLPRIAAGRRPIARRDAGLPGDGAGVYGWEAETVARRGIGQVLAYDGGVQVVEFVLFSAGLAETFRRVHAELGGQRPGERVRFRPSGRSAVDGFLHRGSDAAAERLAVAGQHDSCIRLR